MYRVHESKYPFGRPYREYLKTEEQINFSNDYVNRNLEIIAWLTVNSCKLNAIFPFLTTVSNRVLTLPDCQPFAYGDALLQHVSVSGKTHRWEVPETPLGSGSSNSIYFPVHTPFPRPDSFPTGKPRLFSPWSKLENKLYPISNRSYS